ncbi:hypothetical protein GQX73_g3077 [Xylaria multiplex]|uniref:Zn(2)-C6 fungal-type domain-containing protein n=1 Tax=Xylaria multiplex TaxID=323545 RepID=A0A7C8IRK7_9PEZI|nr:hypothetical protein GQX73_g3077 [Xylaria multiplex]
MAGDHPSKGHLPRHDQYDDSQYPPVPVPDLGTPELRAMVRRPPPPTGIRLLPVVYPRPPGHVTLPQVVGAPTLPQAALTSRTHFRQSNRMHKIPGVATPQILVPRLIMQPRTLGLLMGEQTRTITATVKTAVRLALTRQNTQEAAQQSVLLFPMGNLLPGKEPLLHANTIRCSGYANSPGGKCTNCIKMNQECVFQPVSSTSSTAFVPVSALPNGVPPGVQLFGAYGQPLAAGPSNYPPGANYQATPPHYEQPLPSPTGSNSSYWEDRPENSRRRHRMSDDHGVRLPPPNTFPDDNSRRRSPSSSSPNHLQPYQASQPQPIPHQGFDNRTPPPRGSPSGAPASSASGSSVMNLENIMSSNPSGNDIDQSMLGRLNRRTK